MSLIHFPNYIIEKYSALWLPGLVVSRIHSPFLLQLKLSWPDGTKSALMGSGWKWCASLPGFALIRIGSEFHGPSHTSFFWLGHNENLEQPPCTQKWRPHAGDGRASSSSPIFCTSWDCLHETEIKSILFNLLYFGVSLSLYLSLLIMLLSLIILSNFNLLHQWVLNHILVYAITVFLNQMIFYKTLHVIK